MTPHRLRRTEVTKASRIMLPTYVFLCLFMGFNYLTISRNEVDASASFAFADDVMPLEWWSACFFTSGAIQALALVRERMNSFLLGLCLAWATFFVLSCTFFWGWVAEPVPMSAWGWPLFAVICVTASVRSLRHGERQ